MGRDGKPKPKNMDKVGFYSSSGGGGDKSKHSNGTKLNNNEEKIGKLMQNPLFCGKGRLIRTYKWLMELQTYYTQCPLIRDSAA